MRNMFFGFLVCLACSVGAVKYLEQRGPDLARPAVDTVVPSTRHGANGPGRNDYFSITPDREVRIARGAHNQFFVTARVNRQPAPFLVDTGASYVALRESDANKAGIFVSPADFNARVQTANGETRAAFVTVESMEVDSIRIENVEAFILPDALLDTNLLGMSFLSELSSVEARRGELILKG